MMRDYVTRHLFMAIAIALLLLSPVFLVFAPPLIVNTLYHTSESWYVYISGKSYFVYGASYLFFVLAVFTLFLLAGRKLAIVVCVAFLILCATSFYAATQNYTSLADDSITYRESFLEKQHVYAWHEVEKVTYLYAPTANLFAEYEFSFKDGDKLILTENDIVRGLRDSIRNRLKEENIEVLW